VHTLAGLLKRKSKTMSESASDRYGFLTRNENGTVKPSKIAAKEAPRTQKWLRMITEPSNKYHVMRSRVFQRRIKKGIPHDLRGRVWTSLLLDITEEDMRWAEGLLKLPHADLMTTIEGKEALEAIKKDLARTFPTHKRFGRADGHDALLSVLAAYAAADPEVGYCQGMSFLTALFLMTVDEPQALCILNRVMTKPMWLMRDLFKPRMPAVALRMFQYDRILSRACRRVHSHFSRLEFEPSMYATHWFTTVFSYNFPFVLVMRVWDIFLLEGWPIVMGVAAAIWRLNQKATLKVTSFEHMFDFLKEIIGKIDEDYADVVIKDALWVVQWYASADVLHTLEQEYHRNQNKGKGR
jgi:hypothetical protein